MEIISRSRWGACHPDGFRDAPLPAAELWLHHSVTLAPDIEWVDVDGDGVEDDEERAMRTIEDIGQANFGGGFSYTWAIMPSGRIYQGHSVHRQGAHTYGRNDKARAVVYVGNYETHAPTEAQKRSAAWLAVHAHDQGWIKYPRYDGGHRDVYATACPGSHAYAAIPEINELAASGGLEDDMQPDERKALMDIRGYLYAGGPDVEKGVGHRHSVFGRVTDTNKALAAVYELTGRNIGQVLAEQAAQIAELSAKFDHVAAGSVDHDLLADKLADRLAKRLEA